MTPHQTQNSDFQSQFSVPKIGRIFLKKIETAADYVYISESNENWEKYLTQR